MRKYRLEYLKFKLFIIQLFKISPKVFFGELLGWLLPIFFIFSFIFILFGRDIYNYYFKPSELEIYMKTYKTVYGVDLNISDDIKEILKKNRVLH